MAFKAIVAICASALLVQGAFSQCAAGLAGIGAQGLVGFNGLNGFNGLAGAGLAGAYGAGCGCGGVASTGGGLPVSSASPIAPYGVSVVSENAYEGTLAAGGNLPFLGTVALEGVLPTAGAGAVSYGCGNGAVGIAVEEGPIATGIAPSAGIAGIAAPGLAGVGYNGLEYNGLGYNGLGYNGLGCNGLGYNGLGYNGLGGLGYGSAGCGCGYGAIL